MLRTFILLVGVLLALPLVPTAAPAADGDGCETAATDYDGLGMGQMRPVWCVVICDNDSTNGDCSEFDLNDARGVPDVIAFELHENGTADCTAGTVTINTSFDQGLTTSSTNAFDLDPSVTAVALGGTRRLVIDTKSAPLGRYILATTSAMACTADSLDLLMIGYEERKQ